MKALCQYEARQGRTEMIRQAINCDMCGAERLEGTSRWFVADEVKGEIRLRGWESPQKSRRNARHLCGQKCVQRMMDNFTATLLAGQQAGKAAAKEAAELAPVAAAAVVATPVTLPPSPAASAKAPVLVESALDRDELPILERMGYDRETIAQVEADSWAGPVREIPAKPKETPAKEQAKDTWGAETRGEKGFIHATRLKPQPLRTTFQRMA
jgi:hypothetical protein